MNVRNLCRFATLQPFGSMRKCNPISIRYMIEYILEYSCIVAYLVKTLFNNTRSHFLMQLLGCKKLQMVANVAK